MRNRKLGQRTIKILGAIIERVTARKMRLGRIGGEPESAISICLRQVALSLGRIEVVINPAVQDREVGDGKNELRVKLDGAFIKLSCLFELRPVLQ